MSSPEYHSQNKETIRNILRLNNYPMSLTNRVINQYKNNLNNNETKVDTDNFKYYKFPYVRGLSEEIEKHIKKCSPNCRLAFYNTNVVSSVFTRLKDPIPLDFSSGLVYRIPCSGCDKCYIGMTKQYLKTRIYQHRYDCREINRNKSEKTALSQHHFTADHTFDFNEVSILDRESNYYKRCLSEMIYITLNNTVNCRSDTQGLSIQYNYLLHLYKEFGSNVD